MTIRLTKADHDRVDQAIAEAEKATRGEILCVLKRRTSTYGETPVAWAAAAALTFPLVLLVTGVAPPRLDTLLGGWTIVHGSPLDQAAASAVAAYALIQAAIFAAVYALTWLRPVRLALTPSATKHRRARKYALEQFLAQGMHLTEGRTGVMIFASLEDHHVEVIADEGIYAEVDPSVWNAAAKALADDLKRGRPVEGFEAAVALVGKVLAEHFPAGADNPNERPDKLVVI